MEKIINEVIYNYCINDIAIIILFFDRYPLSIFFYIFSIKFLHN